MFVQKDRILRPSPPCLVKPLNSLMSRAWMSVMDLMAIQMKLFGFEHKGMRYTAKVSSVICDIPARAFVKKVKSHTGYYDCDKCNQSGEWLGKLIFPETNATQRTDVAFDEMADEHHHLGPSPLVGCGIGMVSQFPLDYMHLVCLGVMRRLLMLLIKGPLLCRLGPRVVTHISDSLEAMKSFMPESQELFLRWTDGKLLNFANFSCIPDL